MLYDFPWASCLTTLFTVLTRGKYFKFVTLLGTKQRGKRQECHKYLIRTLIHFLIFIVPFFSKYSKLYSCTVLQDN